MNQIKWGILFALAFIYLGCQSGADPKIGSVVVDGPFDIEMVYIPAGDVEWEANATRHAMTVHLEPFYIGRYEVTQKQWKAVMGSYPPQFDWEALPVEFDCNWASEPIIKELTQPSAFIGDDLPVERVAWDTVQVFLKRLSEATGHVYRLPTLAEWEHACRAGSTGPYHFGNDTTRLGEYEWFEDNAHDRPHPVGQKKPNAWGLYDMSGNVAEWTATIADMFPYEQRFPGRDFGPGISRVYKGSHYQHNRFAALIEYSHTYQQALPRGPVGFRVVRER